MPTNRKPGPISAYTALDYSYSLPSFYEYDFSYKLPNYQEKLVYDVVSGTKQVNASSPHSNEPHISGAGTKQKLLDKINNPINKFLLMETIKGITDDAINSSKWILKFDSDFVNAAAKVKQGRQTIKQLASSVAGYTDEAAMLKKYIPGSSNKVAEITRKIQELETKISLKKLNILKNKEIASQKLSFMNKASTVLEAGGAVLWGYEAITKTIELNEKIADDEAEVTDFCEMALVLLQAPLPIFGLGAPIAAVGLMVIEEQKKMLKASLKAIESMYGFLEQVFKIILNIKSGKLITAAIKSRAKTINSRTPYAEHERILFHVSESIQQLIATTVKSLVSTKKQIADHDWMEREVIYRENRDDWNNKITSYINTLTQLQQDRKAYCTAHYILFCSYFLNQELLTHLATIRVIHKSFLDNQYSYKRRAELLEEKKSSLQGGSF